MAAFDTSAPAATFSQGRIAHFAKSVVGNFAAWNDQRVTRKSLSKLSARELDDIGLSFGDIESIAKRITR